MLIAGSECSFSDYGLSGCYSALRDRRSDALMKLYCCFDLSAGH